MSLLGGSHATPRQGTEAIRALECLTCGACMGMLRFPSLSRDSSCREKAVGLLPALPARGVPPCPGCDGATPLLPPCLHMESVWCIGAVRACPIQTKHSQEVQQAGPGERDASSGRPAWQGPGGLCFGALQHFSSWKAPLKEGRSMAPSQVLHSPVVWEALFHSPPGEQRQHRRATGCRCLWRLLCAGL